MSDNQTNQSKSSPTIKNPLRVALVVDKAAVKDYSVCLQHFLVGLADESYPCALICPPGCGAGSMLCPSVELIKYPMFKIPLFWLQNRKALLASLIKFKPTVLHGFCSSKARLIGRLAQHLDIPYVLTFNSPAKKIFKPFISARHCAALVASSETIAESLSRSYPRLVDRISQVNIGSFVHESSACFCDSARTTSMIVADSLDNPMDFEPLLGAMRHLAVDGYEFILAIVGTGPAEKSIRRQVISLGLSQNVTIVPDIQPLRLVLAGADIFIQPRPALGLNYRLLEAMSVGMAAAVCRGGIEDGLTEGQTAVFFDGNDELSVYSSLQRLLSRRKFARQLALNGQAYLKEHHSVSKMTSALIQTYRKAQQWYKSSTE